MRITVLLVSAVALATAIGAGSTRPAGLDVSVGPVGVSVGGGDANVSVGGATVDASIGGDGANVSVGIGDTSPDEPQTPDAPAPDPDPQQPPPTEEPPPTGGPGPTEAPPPTGTSGNGGGAVAQSGANGTLTEGSIAETPNAEAAPLEEAAVLSEEAATERGRLSANSTLTHDGGTRVLAFERQADRLEALLALVTDCSLYTGLDGLIDDRRIRVVELGDVLEQSFEVRLMAALLVDSAGRDEALRIVRRNAELSAVLDRETVPLDEVVALQVGANGVTDVFVLDDGFAIPGAYAAAPWLRVFPWLTVSPWRRASILAQDCPVEDPIITGSVRPGELLEPLSGAPQALPPPLDSDAEDVPLELATAPPEPARPDEELEPITIEPEALSPQPESEADDAVVEREAPTTGIDELTASAAELGALLDRVAVVDAQLLQLDADVRPGVIEAADAAAEGTGLVLSTHALAEAIARSEGVSPQVTDDGRDILTGSIDPDMRAEAIEERASDRRLAAACADFIDSLVEDLERLTVGLAASEDMYLVPIQGCVPRPDHGEAVSTMRSMLAADARVRTKLASSGYQPQDLVGASIDDAGRLSIFVVH